MNFKSVDRIISAKDYGGSARGYIRKQQQALIKSRMIAVPIHNFEREPEGIPVYARIWQGQWIADCECKGAAFVDPDEPVFFCFSCGNRAHGQMLRPVIFPPQEERAEIERLILERPVDDLAGLTDNERAGMAKPVLYVQDGGRAMPLTRSWEPGQSVDDLKREQDMPIKQWKKTLKAG